MPPNTPQIVFQQPLFGHNLDQLHKVIASPQNLATRVNAATAAAQKANLAFPQAVGDEALALYNATVTDGRYIQDFKTDPAGVAAKLGLPISQATVDAIKEVSSLGPVRTPGGAAEISDVVAAAIIVLVLAVSPDQELVVDSSGLLKP